MSEDSPEEPRRLRRSGHWGWVSTWSRHALLLVLAVPLIEMGAQLYIRAQRVEPADWARAARYVEAQLRARDAVVVAPAWADPLLRHELGHRIGLDTAARSDLVGYRRLWALTARGQMPAEAPNTAPGHRAQLGPVTVLRWELPTTPAVRYRFLDHVAQAEVTLGRRGRRARRCRFVDSRRPFGGGLGAGPLRPRARHVCDPRRPWLWVGVTTMEDLELKPRRCVWQHPAEGEPVTTTFREVPLGDRIVLYGGIYYEHERHRAHGPVHAVVRVNGEEVGRLIHRDGDGFARAEMDTRNLRARGPATRSVSVEVRAPRAHLRSFCWTARVESDRRP